MDSFAKRMRGPFCEEGDHSQATLIRAIHAGSPYLTDLLTRLPKFTAEIFASSLEQLFNSLIEETHAAGLALSREAFAQKLRRLKSQMALLIALCDLGQVWSLNDVTGALTRFADAAVSAAVNTLLREARNSGKLKQLDPAWPSRGSGYVVLAMGKHGAGELNYSSDIDLIILYDPETAPLADGVEPGTFFVKLTRALVALLQDVDEHGYVFRVDLRLRPDPRATQVAIALESAAVYYENMGQNWERAAYIKARPVAGDIALGEDFLARLVPYVWRKYLDFAAIADVQSLIRQIHAVKGHSEIAIEGHNLKLGRGGIREIEFFVQTQQLIAGGRNPKLRGRRTVEMLHALADAGWIEASAAQELEQAYTLLRTLEHRAQMQNDQQTHVVPEDLERFARFSGFADAASFRQTLRETLECVTGHSSKLFAESGQLGSDDGSLVFTGGEDDPATLETLRQLGFTQTSEISATVRSWHFGRYNATRDRRAREALTELMPKLLKTLAISGDADRTFHDFDRFLQGLPAGVQLFAMLKSNPHLLDLLALILGTAPRLAEGLSHQPRVLEAVLDPAFFGPLPDAASLQKTLEDQTPHNLSLDEVMDRVRVFKREQAFRVGVRVLSDTVAAEVAGEGFSNIADAVITRLFTAVKQDMEKSHGLIEQGAVAIIAMGKLGGHETTAASDLDLIIVFDHANDVQSSSGPRGLAPGPYYSRFAQRLISALSVLTSEGPLYDVDMRLRPSGSKGPVAVSFAAFETYQREDAWTWERLALTRARIVTGDCALSTRLSQAIRHALTLPRDTTKTRDDVRDMRRLMVQQHNSKSVWDIKRCLGGLVEIEFIAQYLQLTHGPQTPHVLNTNTLTALATLGAAGHLSRSDLSTLQDAAHLYHRLTHLLRLCLDIDFVPATARPGLTRAITQSTNLPSIAQIEALLSETQSKVSAVFEKIVGR